jgi:hypothetical protein
MLALVELGLYWALIHVVAAPASVPAPTAPSPASATMH